jgi:hypothetical protein
LLNNDVDFRGRHSPDTRGAGGEPFSAPWRLQGSKQLGDKTVFFWIEKGKNWLGLWENIEATETKFLYDTLHLKFQ